MEDKTPQNLVILPPDRTVYFNGFSMGLGTGDLVITLMRNGTAVLTLNCSYTVGKTRAALHNSARARARATVDAMLTLSASELVALCRWCSHMS
jgi:hypothetical protein